MSIHEDKTDSMNGSKQTHILQYLLVSLDNNTDGNQLFTRNEVQAKHEKLDDLQKLYLQKQITTYYTTSTNTESLEVTKFTIYSLQT